MECPFLQEAQVRSCSASAHRKLILRSNAALEEKCTTPAFATCAVAIERLRDVKSMPSCPFLRELSARFCDVAAVTRFVPLGAAAPSRCNTGNHRYCELYQCHALPDEALGRGPSPKAPMQEEGAETEDLWVEDVRIPRGLWFAPNHLWLDLDRDGACHIGVDAEPDTPTRSRWRNQSGSSSASFSTK